MYEARGARNERTKFSPHIRMLKFPSVVNIAFVNLEIEGVELEKSLHSFRYPMIKYRQQFVIPFFIYVS